MVRLWNSAEPVTSPSSSSSSSTLQLLQQFSDDLGTTMVVVLFQALHTDLLEEQGSLSTVAQLNQVSSTTDHPTTQLVEAMNEWVGGVVGSWVQYYLTRSQLKAGVAPLGEGVTTRGRERRARRDDMCQAIAWWDIKMAQETRVVMENLVLHYTMLEGALQEVRAAAAEQPREVVTFGMYT